MTPDAEALDRRWLALAVEQAMIGLSEGGIPIGAVLVHGGELLGVGRNRRVQQGSVIRHGETDCLENAGRLGAGDLYEQRALHHPVPVLHVCRHSAALPDPARRRGREPDLESSEELLRSHGVRVDVLDDLQCREMMSRFIEEKPALWNEDIGLAPRVRTCSGGDGTRRRGCTPLGGAVPGVLLRVEDGR